MGQVYGEPSLAKDIQKMRDDILDLQNSLRLANSPILTQPPPNPYDGQVIILKGSEDTPTKAGVPWTFRYNAKSLSSFKWEFIGGAAPKFFTQPYINTSLVGGFGVASEINGTASLPIFYTGEYEVEWQIMIGVPTAATFSHRVSKDAVASGVFENLSGYSFLTANEHHKTGASLESLSARDVLKMYLTCSGGAQNPTIYYTSIKVTPVKIG